MASVNQTRPHCVNQMGKTHSKPLAARHGRGPAWAPHGHGMLCVNRPLFMVWLFFSHWDGSQVPRCYGVFLMRPSQSEFVRIKAVAMEATGLSFQIIHQIIIQKLCISSLRSLLLFMEALSLKGSPSNVKQQHCSHRSNEICPGPGRLSYTKPMFEVVSFSFRLDFIHNC